MSFDIESDHVIPATMARTPRAGKYPWRTMEIGDSFFSEETNRNRIGSAASKAAKKTGFRFTVRVVDGGIRVWRVA